MEDSRSQTEEYPNNSEEHPNNFNDCPTELVMTYDKNVDKLRSLWDESFDDSEGFSDFYFDSVVKDNKILSAYVEDELVGMIHLNPYKIWYDSTLADSYYIVGVAVSYDYRGQGIMKSMMKKVCQDMKEEHVPFAFLMPKLEDYYISSGFQKVYNTRQLDYSIIDNDDFEREISDCYASLMLYTEHLEDIGEDLFDKVADNINDNLRVKYLAFAERSHQYLSNMIEEHRCQNGNVCVVTERMMDEGDDEESINLIGLFSYDIYDDTMYVDRFEAFVDNTMPLVVAALKQVTEVSCGRCIITAGEADLEDFDLMISGADVDISDGKGIMAIPVCSKKDDCMGILLNNCFFDEII